MAQETGNHSHVKDSFQKDIPDIFSVTVEVDETYYWGTMEPQRKDTAPKPLVVNVEEGVPKLLFWHLRPRWKGVGTSGF